MLHRTLPTFWNRYHHLPREIRDRADQQFALLKNDMRHPSLQLKKVASSKGREVWSARVTLQYRALALRQPDQFLWFWIGDHADYDRMISQL